MSRSPEFGLGAVQLVHVESDTWVANMVAQHGYGSPRTPRPLREDALETCLTRVAEHARTLNASVHMPRIGTGLCGGDWSTISDIIERTLLAHDIDTTVYDLPRQPR